MNWEAVSAVAELLAVIAVIPALLYLVIELRQNTRALQSQTIDSVIDRMSANAQAVVDSDTLPDLMVREREDRDSLSPAEKDKTRLFVDDGRSTVRRCPLPAQARVRSTPR